MHKRLFTRTLAASAAALALVAALPATAQTGGWPNKPVRMIVPFPAGGSTDLVARYLAQGLSEKLGQQFIVDNRTGASGNIGTDAVAKAAADGYTIGLVTSGPLVNNKFLFKSMPFDADKDLAPIAMVCDIPMVVASNPQKSQAKDLKQFVAASRTDAQGAAVGMPGNGTIGHLALVSMNMAANANMRSIPYRGDVPAMADVLGGSIDALVAPITAFIPNLSAGKLRGLAVTSDTRFPGLPEIPTAKEQGIDVKATVWLAVVGPTGTPDAIVQKLNTEINALLNSPYGRGKLQQYGAIVVTGAPSLLHQRIASEGKTWQKVIQTANIQPD